MNTKTFLALLALVAVFWFYTKRDGARADKPAAVEVSSTTSEEPASTALEGSGETVAGETYPEFDARRDALAGTAGSYEGYGCTQDCGGHSAGYQWAENRGVTDESECGGNSWSFREGCVAYAQEQAGSQAAAEEEDDEGEEAEPE